MKGATFEAEYLRGTLYQRHFVTPERDNKQPCPFYRGIFVYNIHLFSISISNVSNGPTNKSVLNIERS